MLRVLRKILETAKSLNIDLSPEDFTSKAELDRLVIRYRKRPTSVDEVMRLLDVLMHAFTPEPGMFIERGNKLVSRWFISINVKDLQSRWELSDELESRASLVGCEDKFDCGIIQSFVYNAGMVELYGDKYKWAHWVMLSHYGVLLYEEVLYVPGSTILYTTTSRWELLIPRNVSLSYLITPRPLWQRFE